MGGTIGAVSLDCKTKIDIIAPGVSERNQPVSFRLQAEYEKEILEGLTVSAVIRKPILEKPEVPGVYEAEFTVEGINQVTGQPFSCVKSESIWIG